MLHVITFWWGQKYGREYVDRLSSGVRRHLAGRHRFVVMTEAPGQRGLAQTAWAIPEPDLPLLATPGCFARLRLFDPDWQAVHGIEQGDRIVCLDLDMIITGALDPLFQGAASFVILGGANASNPCPYNGSVWMLRAGAHQDVCRDFSPAAAAKVPFDSFPDDQAWFAARMPHAAVWKVGASSGIYAFQKPGWPGGDDLPSGARIVAFPGRRDPSDFRKLPWVRKHWMIA